MKMRNARTKNPHKPERTCLNRPGNCTRLLEQGSVFTAPGRQFKAVDNPKPHTPCPQLPGEAAAPSGLERNSRPSLRWRAMADRKIEELVGVIERAIQMKQPLGSSLQCSCSTIAECDEFVARRRR
jgi:hypothetical protein